jgi:hypothetical protein
MLVQVGSAAAQYNCLCIRTRSEEEVDCYGKLLVCYKL